MDAGSADVDDGWAAVDPGAVDVGAALWAFEPPQPDTMTATTAAPAAMAQRRLVVRSVRSDMPAPLVVVTGRACQAGHVRNVCA
ncbi:MAG: hypothetical protein ACR2JQ_12145, partial [Mycobacteriales bacterium]